MAICRGLIRTMLCAVLVSLMVSCYAGDAPLDTNNEADVLILGAGIAGLSAAKVLHDHNVSFLLIEATNQIGGRVKSTLFGGKYVELGTQFLHDNNTNEWVNRYSIGGKRADYESVVVRSSGGQRMDDEADAAWEKLATSQVKVLELYDRIRRGQIDDMSVRTALEYANWFPQTAVEDVVEIYDYDYEFGKDPAQISTESYYSVDETQLTPYLLTHSGGMIDILQQFAGEFLQPNDQRLKLNQLVNRITTANNRVTVTTTAGQTFTGLRTIVTFSVNVIKQNRVTFDPPLPEWKLDTIFKTTLDHEAHIYVKFATGVQRFWDDFEYILHANNRRGYYPIILNYEASGLFPSGSNILSFVAFGEEARRIERATDTEVKLEVTAVLRNMFNNQGLPEPEAILVSDWTKNPLFLGSFTSRVMNIGPRFVEALKSRAGLVFFAGEAYHEVLDGFFEGARLSGMETANMIVRCGNDCPQFDPNPPSPTTPPSTCGASALASTVLAVILAFVLCSVL